MMLSFRRITLLLACTAACGGDDSQLRPDAATDMEVVAMRAVPDRDLDLLFVIDNSASTLHLQTSMKDAFPDLLAILDTLDGGRPSLHIGVTSIDLGVTGSLAPDSPGPSIGNGSGSCSGLGDDGRLTTNAAYQGFYLADLANAAGARTTNYTGTLASAFSAAVSIGSNGCGFEQPLRAIERALANPLNAGFLRSDANLGVILIGDEDDCSVRDAHLLAESATELGPLQSFRCTAHGLECNEDLAGVGTKTGCHAREDSAYVDSPRVYADLLRNLKPDPRMVVAASIAGPTEPVEVELRTPPGGGDPILALAHACSWSPTPGIVVADAAPRLAEFIVDLQSPDSLALSVCNSDLRPQLTTIGRSLKRVVGDPCIDTTSLADTSPDPGIQPRCTAYDELAGTRTELPACADASSPDCFELVADEASCPYVTDHLRVRIRRSATPSTDVWTHVRCGI